MNQDSDETTGALVNLPDERLVKECLNGNSDAWSAILGKYRKLIYSVPIKYGLPPEDAGDIFQQVCVHLLEALPTLREPRSLAAWLIKVAANGCFQWAGRERRFQSFDFEAQPDEGPVSRETPDTLIRQFERSQILHDALAEAPARCRELIRMLFFETPAVSYDEAAKRLGLATGSIGFIRMRCLDRLRKRLEEKGFA
ncbi:MAG: sigma-70 family RNA polymerase sigma factor [Acidobacteriia bacterium]|nr:sigma-70 family RNA polymerase sigma factor [Terriglobia bacterium]